MILKDILSVKGKQVFTIGPTASVADAVHALVHNNCGSLVVCDQERMVGIITERDILRAVNDLQQPLEDVAVEQRMSRDVVTGTPEDKVSSTMGLMTNHRIRHLPILKDGQLAGVISIGDIVKAQHDQLSAENHYLKVYIQS